MKELIYWIKFDGVREPQKIIAKSYEELEHKIRDMVEYFREPYEWLIRDYN